MPYTSHFFTFDDDAPVDAGRWHQPDLVMIKIGPMNGRVTLTIDIEQARKLVNLIAAELAAHDRDNAPLG